MSLVHLSTRMLRGVLIAAATAAVVLALLAMLQPGTQQAPVVGTGNEALAGRIEALRVALRDGEAELSAARATAGTAPDAASQLQVEAQLAAATERRDLARRQAEAIRAGLAAGGSVAALAPIRSSVVIGQLLVRQSTLDAQIATDGARLQSGHPTMRALRAQRDALLVQIRQEAAGIAGALDTEAAIEDAQIVRLAAQLPAAVASTPTADLSRLETSIAARRAELDRLVDAYFDIAPAAPVAEQPRDLLSPLNLALAAIAAFLAIAVQIGLNLRRRRIAMRADLAAWAADRDAAPASEPATEPEALRQAS